ncbi:AAA family ATPase [Clostridium sp. MCC353]|uniref:shikimate kinase n=1 Tax=Clostridium sp. MCC353 TaxID=2592646 RepID=UPI001C028679|nr:shikimate kinase [Clostridium sp. MCC353]MBT9776300.1 AAA family ATPase [Clostridium sp. MCC353]
MKENIILIGFMGAGKTSVGQELSSKYQKKMVDTDGLIEEKAGMTISDIFARNGEEYFRQLETEVLTELLEQADDMVISVGGGLPMREENRAVLRELGEVVYLQVEPQTVLERLKGDTTRPLLQGDQVEKKVADLMDFRGPVYEKAAHKIVRADGRSLEEIAEEIYRPEK